MRLAPIVCNQLLKGLQLSSFFVAKGWGGLQSSWSITKMKNIQSHVFSLAKCHFPPKETLFLAHILDCCSRIWNSARENLFLKRIITNLELVRLPDSVVGRGTWLLWNQRSYIGETYLKMTTRARAFYLLKNRIKLKNQELGIRLLLDLSKSDSKALVPIDWYIHSPIPIDGVAKRITIPKNRVSSCWGGGYIFFYQ